MIELVFALAIAGIMLAAALNCVGASARTERLVDVRSRGRLLAQELMAEILARDYEEPIEPPLFGREGGESATQRADWDDIDDYDNWSATPPRSRTGVAMSGLDDMRRAVDVDWVSSDLASTLYSESGVKRITVTVSNQGVPISTATAFRTAAWPGEPEIVPVVPPGPFGYDTIFPTPANGSKKIQIATQAVLDVDATITQMAAYIGGTNKKCRFAIYSDEAGEPASLIVESDSFNTDDTDDWYSAPISPTPLTAGSYWLVFALESDDHWWYHESGGELRYKAYDAAKDGFLASWGVSDDWFAIKASIHAIYIEQ